MKLTTNIHNAKTHLSQFVQKAYEGEEVIICKAGKPMAKLVQFTAPTNKPRIPGRLKGKIWISDDFEDPLPKDILDAFCGEKE